MNRLVAVVLAAVFAVLTLVLAVVVITDDGDDSRDDVARVAGQFGEALYSVDHDDLAGYRERVLQFTTGGFEGEFARAESVLFPYLAEIQIVQSATVQTVFVTEVDDGAAEAVVAVDTRSESTAGSTTQLNNYVRVGLVKVSGSGWKVDNVIYLDLGDGGTGGLDPALLERLGDRAGEEPAASTTTVPAG